MTRKPLPLVLMALLCLAPLMAPAAEDAKPKAKSKSAKSSKSTKPVEPAGFDINNMPDTLREQFGLTFGPCKFNYMGDSGEWRLIHKPLGSIVEGAKAAVILGDGARVELSTLRSDANFTFKKGKTDFGETIDLSATLKGPRGLTITQITRSHESQPFMFLSIKVTNNNSTPIEIAGFEVANLGVTKLDAATRVGKRSLQPRGPWLVPAGDAETSMISFEDMKNDFSLTMGVHFQRVCETTVALQGQAGNWHVVFTSKLSPAILLAPGANIESDPIWMSFSQSEGEDVDLRYAWFQSMLPRPKYDKKMPYSWAAPAAGETFQQAVSAWSGTAVDWAVVPGGWEANYKSIGGEARTAKASGMSPGLTLDPLLFPAGAQGAWTSPASDGLIWVNIASPEGKQYAVKHFADAGGDYDFLVIACSAIPDAALRQFGLTRAQLDAVAFQLAGEACPGKPVLPAPVLNLGADLDGWLSAASATARMREFDTFSGPVACDAAALDNPGNEILTAMALYGGPIVFTGKGSAKLRNAVDDIIPPIAATGQPQHIGGPVKVWRVKGDGAEGKSGLLVFAGASETEIADVAADQKKTIWQAASGDVLSIAPRIKEKQQAKTTPPAEEVSPDGIAPHEASTKPKKRGFPWWGRKEAQEPVVTAQASPSAPAPVVDAAPAPPPPPAAPVVTDEAYVIASGDTLSKIAKKQGVTVDQLLEWNSLKISTALKIGQKLIIKRETTDSTPTATPAPAPAPVAAVVPAPVSALDAAEETYVVVSGDSLSKIASKQGVTMDQLREWNGLKGDMLKVGQKLIVKREMKAPEQPAPAPTPPPAPVVDAPPAPTPDATDPASLAPSEGEPKKGENKGFFGKVKGAFSRDKKAE